MKKILLTLMCAFLAVASWSQAWTSDPDVQSGDITDPAYYEPPSPTAMEVSRFTVPIRNVKTAASANLTVTLLPLYGEMRFDYECLATVFHEGDAVDAVTEQARKFMKDAQAKAFAGEVGAKPFFSYRVIRPQDIRHNRALKTTRFTTFVQFYE